jgi:hypothetical protein
VLQAFAGEAGAEPGVELLSAAQSALAISLIAAEIHEAKAFKRPSRRRCDIQKANTSSSRSTTRSKPFQHQSGPAAHRLGQASRHQAMGSHPIQPVRHQGEPSTDSPGISRTRVEHEHGEPQVLAVRPKRGATRQSPPPLARTTQHYDDPLALHAAGSPKPTTVTKRLQGGITETVTTVSFKTSVSSHTVVTTYTCKTPTGIPVQIVKITHEGQPPFIRGSLHVGMPSAGSVSKWAERVAVTASLVTAIPVLGEIVAPVTVRSLSALARWHLEWMLKSSVTTPSWAKANQTLIDASAEFGGAAPERLLRDRGVSKEVAIPTGLVAGELLAEVERVAETVKPAPKPSDGRQKPYF